MISGEAQRSSLAPGTPLWPADQLPLKGGDWLAAEARARHLMLEADDFPISPLEGEMAGRPEGGEEAVHLRLRFRDIDSPTRSNHTPCS